MAPAEVDDLAQVIADCLASFCAHRQVAIDFVEEQRGARKSQAFDHLGEASKHKKAVGTAHLLIDSPVAHIGARDRLAAQPRLQALDALKVFFEPPKHEFDDGLAIRNALAGNARDMALDPALNLAARLNMRARSEEHTSELQSRPHLV